VKTTLFVIRTGILRKSVQISESMKIYKYLAIGRDCSPAHLEYIIHNV